MMVTIDQLAGDNTGVFHFFGSTVATMVTIDPIVKASLYVYTGASVYLPVAITLQGILPVIADIHKLSRVLRQPFNIML